VITVDVWETGLAPNTVRKYLRQLLGGHSKCTGRGQLKMYRGSVAT
jgi:hypothetical protein